MFVIKLNPLILWSRNHIPSVQTLKVLEFQGLQILEGGTSILFQCQSNLSLLLLLLINSVLMTSSNCLS